MSRHKTISVVFWLLLAFNIASAQEIRIGVLGLFRPQQLVLSVPSGTAMVLQLNQRRIILESSAGNSSARVTRLDGELLVESGDLAFFAHEIHATNRGGTAADFRLAIPGKICRNYHGTLDVKASSGVLQPVVNMDLETAVASTVQAESEPGTPLAALEAQAVAARSYYMSATARHADFDFCDTTHCQYLRGPASEQSSSWLATVATHGLVLAYVGRPIAAMFTRSCGGITRTPAELDMATDGYPYFAVICEYCQRKPFHWRSELSRDNAEWLLAGGEAARLRIGRQLGWNVVPSNNFTVHAEGSRIIVEGKGEGHGIGMCQRGAKAMAEDGAEYREILNYYYPNTQVVYAGSVPDQGRHSSLLH